MVRKPTDIVTFTLRMREDLRRKLEREANKRDHSMNIEIIERLEASFEGDRIAQALETASTKTNTEFGKLADWITRDLAEDIAGAMLNHLKGADGEAWLNKLREAIARVPAAALAVDQTTTPKDET